MTDEILPDADPVTPEDRLLENLDDESYQRVIDFWDEVLSDCLDPISPAPYPMEDNHDVQYHDSMFYDG